MENLEKLKAVIRGKKILLLGPPGSGKGNRSRDLTALGLIHVASGVALRTRVREDPDSALSKRALEFMKRGALVPDDIVVPIVMAHLNRKECLKSGFVLDGFPRTRAQADLLFSQVELDLVLLLDVPRKFLVYGVVEGGRRACVECATGYSDFDPPKIEGVCDRCGGEIVVRVDDNPETIRKRLNVYDEQIGSILPDLESTGIVEVLPITVGKDEQIDDSHLKKLRGDVYWVETDKGGNARMLNFEGMKERLNGFLAMKFL